MINTNFYEKLEDNNNFENNIFNEIRNEIRNEIGDEIRNEIRCDICNEIINEIIDAIHNDIPANNSNNISNYMHNELTLEIVETEDSEYSITEKKYMEPTILENINLEKYFKPDDIQLSTKNKKKLKITDKGLYSISKFNDAEWITNIILSFLIEKKINKREIVDGTAGIGGNTINFARNFSKVHAVEINNIHYDVLKNNLDALSIKNVTLYLDNFLNILNILNNSCNIFFFDPPWGGKTYKNFKYFNLKIGKLPVYSVINLLYEKKFKYVILKAPYNLNISPIFNNIKYENMNIHSNFKKNMMLVIFY